MRKTEWRRDRSGSGPWGRISSGDEASTFAGTLVRMTGAIAITSTGCAAASGVPGASAIGWMLQSLEAGGRAGSCLPGCSVHFPAGLQHPVWEFGNMKY